MRKAQAPSSPAHPDPCTDEDATLPAGFARLHLGPNGFIDSVGPLYGRIEQERFTLGLRVQARHCNPAGSCHGGMLMTLADMLLIIATNVQAGLSQYLTTVQMSTDFIRPIARGAWIEGRCEVLRVAKSLIFSQGTFIVEGEIVARVSGILKPTGAPDAAMAPGRYFAKGRDATIG
jgi:uncharacterized protein (TIGR00369 family)